MNNPSLLGGRKEGLWQEYRHNYTYWCVVTMHFPLLEVEDVKCSPPDDKVYKGNVVRDVIVFVPKKIIDVPRCLLMRQKMIQMVY